jgi:hypothetical protein
MSEPIDVEPVPERKPVRSLRRALRGEHPVFGFQISNGREGDAQLLRWIASNCPKVELAAVLPLLNRKAGTGTDWMQPVRAASLRFADPQLYVKPDSGWLRLKPPSSRATSHDFLNRWPGHENAPTPARVREVLDAQVDAGANVMLSASGWVKDTDAAKSLNEAMAWVAASRDELEDETMFVNLTLPSTWLTDTRLREALQEELVESREKYWFLRFQWPTVATRYGQLVDARVLDGYKKLVTLAADEDKFLFLPQTGLTGWVATALGAAGFSTGRSWASQAFDVERQGGGTGGGRDKWTQRYFDPSILHTVERTVHQSLRGLPSAQTCACPYSRNLSVATDWDHDDAGRHNVAQSALLTNLLGARDPRARARRRVRQAQAFVQNLPSTVPLTGDSAPRHLSLWAGLLA